MSKNALKMTVMVGLFAVPFIPFLVSSSLFFPFITTKAFVWRVIVEIIFAAWILLAVAEPAYRPKKSIILYALGAFFAVIGLADLFGVASSLSFWSNFERMEGFVSLLHLGMFFLVIGSIFDEHNWKRWWNTSLVASLLMIFYCIFQMAGVIALSQGGVRVDGTFGNASYLAVYMLIHIFLSLLFMLRQRTDVVMRSLYGALALGQFFVLYHTATRGAILGLLGGILIVAVLNIRNREDRHIYRVSIGLLIALVVVVGGFFALRGTSFVKESPVLSRFTSISTEELKSGGRSFVWPIALKGVKERPFLGWGQENFMYVFQEHYQPEMYHLEPWFDRAHNIFLDWAVAGGILGLISYLSLYGVILYLIWKRDENFSYLEKTVLTGLLAAYFFHNFFVFDHLISYILFFSLLAYVYSRDRAHHFWEGKQISSSVSPLLLSGVVGALVLLLYFVNLKPLQANLSLLSALNTARSGDALGTAASFRRAYGLSILGRGEVVEQMTVNAQSVLAAGITMEEKNEFYSFAREAIVGEADKYAGSARYQIIAGSFLSLTGASDEAIKYLEKARALIPGKQLVYFELGTALINKGETSRALETFKTAFEMAPENIEAKKIYLIGAIYAGNMQIESELKSEFPEREIVFDDRVLSAYYNKKRFAETIVLLERRKQLDPANALKYDEFINQVRNSN